MTAKEYLNQIYILEAKYQSKIEQVEDLRLLATSTGAIRYDKVNVIQSISGDKMSDMAIKIVEMENDAMRVAVKLADTKQDIIDKIIGMEDGNYIRILCKHYVHRMKLSDIADDMHFTYDYIRELHGKSLKAFEDTYPQIKDILLTTK